MLVTSIPIIDFDEFKKDRISFNNSNIGICINTAQLQSPETIRFFFDTNLSHFICIDFRNEKTFLEQNYLENIRQLILLSFNINYLKIDTTPVLAILSNYENLKEIPSEIRREFIKQGYDSLILLELNENKNYIFKTTNCFFTAKDLDKNELISFYNLYFNEDIINKMFLVYSEKNKTKSIIEKINNIEISFANAETNYYSALLCIQKLKVENNLLISENKKLNQQTQNAEINLKFLKKDAEKIIEWHKKETEKISDWYGKEIEKIKDWYYLQYEILPSWFKKIGNIIKKTRKN